MMITRILLRGAFLFDMLCVRAENCIALVFLTLIVFTVMYHFLVLICITIVMPLWLTWVKDTNYVFFGSRPMEEDAPVSYPS